MLCVFSVYLFTKRFEHPSYMDNKIILHGDLHFRMLKGWS